MDSRAPPALVIQRMWLRTSLQLVGFRMLQCGFCVEVEPQCGRRRPSCSGDFIWAVLVFNILPVSSPLKEETCFSLFLLIQFVLQKNPRKQTFMCSFGKGIFSSNRRGSNTVTDFCVDNQRSGDAFEPGGLPETVILSVQRSPSWQIETLYLPECLHNFQGKCSF